MGKSSPWLAYFGSHDKTGDQTTLLFLDNPNNPRFPTKWFARNSYAALVSFAFMFDEVYQLAPGEELILAYQIVIADGHWTIAQIDDFINQIRLVGHAGAAVEIDY